MKYPNIHGINRITLSNILKKNYKPAITVEVKLNNFYEKNIDEIELGQLTDINLRNSCLINTPDGWQKGIGFVDKGDLHCNKVITKNNVCIAADKHMFQLSNNEWLFCDKLKVGDKLLTDNGESEILSIEDAGIIPCYDITINHENHRYFLDGISSHNTGKSLLAALIMSNALKQGYDHIFYFDSEGGRRKNFF